MPYIPVRESFNLSLQNVQRLGPDDVNQWCDMLESLLACLLAGRGKVGG